MFFDIYSELKEIDQRDQLAIEEEREEIDALFRELLTQKDSEEETC